MPVAKPRFVLVDTNAFIRLYCSPVLPLLQQNVGGYLLLTLNELISEFLNSKRLPLEYPWIAKDPKLSDLANAGLKISGINSRKVAERKRELRPYSDALLTSYCRKQGIQARLLSARDLELLASAVVFKAVVATDEWPLSLVVRDLMADPDDDYGLGLMSSLDILYLLEENAKLTRELRIQTCETWQRLNEKLPRDWGTDYERLFGEPPTMPN